MNAFFIATHYFLRRKHCEAESGEKTTVFMIEREGNQGPLEGRRKYPSAWPAAKKPPRPIDTVPSCQGKCYQKKNPKGLKARRKSGDGPIASNPFSLPLVPGERKIRKKRKKAQPEGIAKQGMKIQGQGICKVNEGCSSRLKRRRKIQGGTPAEKKKQKLEKKKK